VDSDGLDAVGPEFDYQRFDNLVFRHYDRLDVQGCGDLNEDNAITVVDALMAAQMAAGLLAGTGLEAVGDVDRSGNAAQPDVTILDALILAQYAAGAIVTLSCPR
jgi:hypothetical protein